MLEFSALQDFHPVVMTPSHDGKYFHNYVVSLLGFVVECERRGVRVDVFMKKGESLVTRARNDCVAAFLANKAWTHLFWIDSDIGFSPEAAFRLLQSDYDVAAGVYPLKTERWPENGVPQGMTQTQFYQTYTRYPVNTGLSPSGMVEINVQPDGFLRLSEAPTGFMLIKRRVFERLMTAYPELQYVPDGLSDVDQGLHYRFFDAVVDPQSRRYLSEDYGFCRLWHALGESVYVDANSNLSHEGAKSYRGDFSASLKNALPFAVGGPAGAQMRLQGSEYLRANPPPRA
ncbi:MAG: hypothetical protein LBV61_01235 [Burkholderiaceae bacterium]|jgi:hypothetical protein|nr:hypothetical protein [Burkholderiaceae bacterium]